VSNSEKKRNSFDERNIFLSKKASRGFGAKDGLCGGGAGARELDANTSVEKDENNYGNTNDAGDSHLPLWRA
jgi:hypothetical protein